MFSLIIYEFTCIDKKTLDHHGAYDSNKQAKGEEKAASMSQMTEMMASIQKNAVRNATPAVSTDKGGQ